MKDEELCNILKYHYRTQYGCFFSELIETENALYTFNDMMECFIWNHVFPYDSECGLDNIIELAEKFYKTRGRKTCIYLDEYETFPRNKKLLDILGYKCVDNEAWMKFSPSKKMNNNDLILRISRVNKLEDLNGFCNICTECFGKQYSGAIKREYNRFQVHKSVSHFLFSIDDVNLGIGSLYHFGEYFFIHNVGIKEQYRKKGYASQLVQLLINEVGINQYPDIKLILQCDGGGFIENMYLKLGFENIYRRWGYLKE